MEWTSEEKVVAAMHELLDSNLVPIALLAIEMLAVVDRAELEKAEPGLGAVAAQAGRATLGCRCGIDLCEKCCGERCWCGCAI